MRAGKGSVVTKRTVNALALAARVSLHPLDVQMNTMKHHLGARASPASADGSGYLTIETQAHIAGARRHLGVSSFPTGMLAHQRATVPDGQSTRSGA